MNSYDSLKQDIEYLFWKTALIVLTFLQRLLSSSTTRPRWGGTIMTSQQQGEAILDVLEQCGLVRLAWEQCEAHARHGQTAFQTAERQAVQEATQEKYNQTLEDLVDLYIVANEAGVPDKILVKVLDGRLPEHIILKIQH